jgi:hypothetical protein
MVYCLARAATQSPRGEIGVSAAAKPQIFDLRRENINNEMDLYWIKEEENE